MVTDPPGRYGSNIEILMIVELLSHKPTSVVALEWMESPEYQLGFSQLLGSHFGGVHAIYQLGSWQQLGSHQLTRILWHKLPLSLDWLRAQPSCGLLPVQLLSVLQN